MKILKDPTQESWGINCLPYLTDEFKKLLENAKTKMLQYSQEEVSYYTVYYEAKGEELSHEYDSCEDNYCIKKAKQYIRKLHGKGIHVKEHHYSNDCDHEEIEKCSICEKPLNDQLTWYEMELQYLEENKPWNAEFLKEQGFLIYCILNNTPSMDCNISDYAKYHQGVYLKNELKRREKFFQRVLKLVQFINKTI